MTFQVSDASEGERENTNVYYDDDDENDDIKMYVNNPMNEKSKKPSDKILDSNFYPDKNIPSFVGKDGKILQEKIEGKMVNDRNDNYEREEYESDDDNYSFLDENEDENEEIKKKVEKKVEDDISSFYPLEKKGELFAESEVQGLGVGKKRESTLNPM